MACPVRGRLQMSYSFSAVVIGNISRMTIRTYHASNELQLLSCSNKIEVSYYRDQVWQLQMSYSFSAVVMIPTVLAISLRHWWLQMSYSFSAVVMLQHLPEVRTTGRLQMSYSFSAVVIGRPPWSRQPSKGFK